VLEPAWATLGYRLLLLLLPLLLPAKTVLLGKMPWLVATATALASIAPTAASTASAKG
jgi:hypothetical protein